MSLLLCQEKKIGEMIPNTTISKNKFIQFLLKARLQGYAGNKPKVKTPQRPGCKEFVTFKEGAFSYRDSYAGYYFAPGQELVLLKKKPFWMMGYSGGMLPKFHGNKSFTKKTYLFLKKVLKESSKDMPFRGPSLALDKDFVYKCKSKGDITQFSGHETIYYKNKMVFKQNFCGGLVKE